MLRPTVRYARTNDGVAIAYSTVGHGPVTIVFASPLISQLEIAWEEPAYEHFITRLATGARVILFDRRGSGLSDHAPSTVDELDLSRLALDVLAVLDAADSDQAVVIGASLGGATAVQFAYEHPERTSALVLIATSPRLTTAPGYEIGIDPDDVDGWIHRAVSIWGAGGSVEAEGPSMAGNMRYREWAGRLERHTASPGDVETMTRAAFGYDVRPLLSELVVRRSSCTDATIPVRPSSTAAISPNTSPTRPTSSCQAKSTPTSSGTTTPSSTPCERSSTSASPAAPCGRRYAAPSAAATTAPGGMP